MLLGDARPHQAAIELLGGEGCNGRMHAILLIQQQCPHAAVYESREQRDIQLAFPAK